MGNTCHVWAVTKPLYLSTVQCHISSIEAIFQSIHKWQKLTLKTALILSFVQTNFHTHNKNNNGNKNIKVLSKRNPFHYVQNTTFHIENVSSHICSFYTSLPEPKKEI